MSSSTPLAGCQGPGAASKPTTAFCTVDEDFTAYGLLDHRHTPEIEQATGAQVLFTPHLAPMNRGILATCYARPAAGVDVHGRAARGPRRLLRRRAVRGGEPMRSPSTKATLGSNTAHLTARFDDRTGWVVVIARHRQPREGGVGPGLQCANIVLGLPEGAGLPLVGVYP